MVVKKQKPITICIRYTDPGEAFMAQTYLGYGGENYKRVPENVEKDAFLIQECPQDCTKGETDLRFGNIPRILYF